ncbi:MAG: regulatory protein RecX [Candidatus Acidiferrales bacterium]
MPAQCYPLGVRSSSPRKFPTEPQLHTAALRALMRRAYSVHEMKDYLKARAENSEHATAVLQRLKEQNYVDDARYARDFARVHAQGRHQGKFRIARELRARGVPDRHIEAALEIVFAETDESASVRSSLERKLRHVRGPLDERKRASIYRSLLRAGFSTDTIRTELRAATKAATAESDGTLAFPGPSGEDI